MNEGVAGVNGVGAGGHGGGTGGHGVVSRVHGFVITIVVGLTARLHHIRWVKKRCIHYDYPCLIYTGGS